MSYSSTRIESYFVDYCSGSNRKRIDLLNSSGARFAYLHFMPEGAMSQADSIVDGKKNLFYRTSDFANCLDILRNEKPCYLRWEGGESGTLNSIGTSIETVGEGEPPTT